MTYGPTTNVMRTISMAIMAIAVTALFCNRVKLLKAVFYSNGLLRLMAFLSLQQPSN